MTSAFMAVEKPKAAAEKELQVNFFSGRFPLNILDAFMMR